MEFSRFVPFWQTKRNFQIHQKKLKTIQSVLRTTKTSFSPLKQRHHSITNQGYNHRNFQIQLQNKALLSKLTKNTTSKPKPLPMGPTLPPNHNHTDPDLDTQNNPISEKNPPQVQLLKVAAKSNKKNTLFRNKVSKRQYFQLFERQCRNRDLLRKIENSRTQYGVAGLEREYGERERIRNLICRFPIKGMKPTKTFLKLDISSKSKERSKSKSPQPTPQQNPNSHSNSFPLPPQPPQTRQTLPSEPTTTPLKRTISKTPHTNPHPNPPVPHTQRRLSQKIKKIHKIKRLNIKGHNILVKGIQYMSHLLLELTLNDAVWEIRVDGRRFEEVYESDYGGVLEGIRFDRGLGEFYVE